MSEDKESRKQEISEKTHSFIKTTRIHMVNYTGQLKSAIKWVLFAILLGVILGFVGALFFKLTGLAGSFRELHPWMIFLLPGAGLLIAVLYYHIGDIKDPGTNLVFESVRAKEKLPPQMAPLIFVCTVITHLFGGSAGREGAALQIGGSIATTISDLLHLAEKDRDIIIMCGMSAAFSAVFGTPLAAAIFSIEVISVGIMQYSALLPCIISALVAHGIASHLLDQDLGLPAIQIPAFSLQSALWIALLAILCAVISVIFCFLMHRTTQAVGYFCKNPFLRNVIGGGLVIVVTLLYGTQDYNGLSIGLLQDSFSGGVPSYAFVFKMILTIITLAFGFKGGEIVPSFVIGATFGNLFGSLSGLSPTLCAAVGLGAVFCGVTNSPITSLLICFELFGFEGMPYYLLAIAISYTLSGYYGLYKSQRFAYSKFRTDYINRKSE